MGSTLSAKQASLKLIERLDENVSYEDIMYELLLLQKVEQGLQDVKEGRTTPHDKMKEEFMEKW